MKEEKEPRSYREQLERQLKKIEKDLIQAHEDVLKNPSHENIRKWNSLNVDKVTINSRIDNLGNTKVVLPSHNINSSILK